MNDVQVWDGQGERPVGENIAPKIDPLMFEKRMLALMELITEDLKDVFTAARDSSGNSNTFMALDQLMTRLKGLSTSRSWMCEDLIRKMKKDLGLDEYQKIQLKD